MSVKTDIKKVIKQFSWVNMSVKDMENLAVDYVAHKKTVYRKIKDILPEDRTFKNTVLEIENSDSVYSDMSLQMHLLSQVSPDKNLRDTASQVEVSLHQKLIDIEYDPDIYTALVEYEMGNYEDEVNGIGKIKKLDVVDKKLFTDMIRAYRRMGFDLSIEKQKELKTKFKTLSKLGTQFRNNINKYDDYISCNLKDLDGCSERFIDTLPKSRSKYKVTLAYPHIGPFLANANNRELRKQLAVKNSKKGGQKNLDLLEKMVTQRISISNLLGHKNYIDYKVEDRMAKKSEKVFEFINDLLKKTGPLVKKDVLELREFAKTLGIKKLETYDIAYVENKLKKQKYDIDTESLRPYFPIAHVLETLFKTAAELFSITLTENKKTLLWHPEAMHIEVRDTKTKKHIANLLLDLYPRTGKYGHAAAFDTQYDDIKTVTLVCNFSTLLSIGEVETLYHEFGHALHFMLSNTKYSSHNGFGVAWDFVETPSQMMENFVWHKKGLETLSHHYKTGNTLPKNTIDKILESKNFLSGLSVTSQLINAKLDLDIHMGPEKYGAKKYNEYYNSLCKKYIGIEKSSESLFPAGFGHMDGYDAGYYSYMWALVYAQDFFSIFKNKGVFSKSVGAKYRKEVLEVGSSRDEVLSAQKFLGRDLNSEAFLKEIGLK